MISKKYLPYLAPIMLFLGMLIDGQLTKAAQNIMDNAYFAHANLLLLLFLLMTPLFSQRYLLGTAFVIGLLYDSYYLGILGIYTVALMLVVLLMTKMTRSVHTNLMTNFFGMIVFVTSFELITVLLQVIFQLSHVNGLLFVTRVLGPTLLFNMFLFVILIMPLKKLFGLKEPII